MKFKVLTIWEWILVPIGVIMIVQSFKELADHYTHDFWCGLFIGLGSCLLLFISYNSRKRAQEAKKKAMAN